ncbi:SDR family oxidoreductase [Labedella populi]|uniref:SDR family oxidoreductase n=1 Tax=Labedella populi TaxID=2498850 RepID=A0A3S4A1N5_9MICO|nr:SDR family oxidoreductase [Labedella populi]RWZ58456.1 SDR family oxidoreductase [Labedella populi]
MSGYTARRVLVTGASRGIGRATAVAFAAAGDRVAVHHGHSRAEAEETLALLDGSGHVIVAGDLSDADQVRRIADDAVRGLGGIDVLVNNAAVGPSAANRHGIADASYESWQGAWRSMVDVDLVGTAHLIFCVARHLIEQGAGGAIVNVGSRGAFVGEPEHAAYAASKAGLHALGQSLAADLAPHGIAVATVAPGFVATERQTVRLSGEVGEAIRSQSPFGRVATPEEVAAAILYLASSDAQWASGAILDLNGASYRRS